MRPWRTRLALRRSRVQWALLSVVLLVATLASTLLATLYLLAVATETFAARAALTDAPAEDLRVVVRVAPDAPLDSVAAASQTSIDEYFGPVPYSTSTHAESALLSLPGDDEDGDASGDITLTYVASMDGVDQQIRITEGAEPTAPGEALVPYQLLEAWGLEVGDPLTLAGVFGIDDNPPLTVAGAFVALEPGTDFWRFDRLQGAGYDPATAVPFSGGRIVTDGYGPLLTDAATADQYRVATVTFEYLPDFSSTSVGQASELVERTEALERSAVSAVGVTGNDVRVTSQLDATLGAVVGSLAVTRSSVLVTGLLLLVLSVAALAQTARLMSERRHAEQSLMVARGSSGRQLLGLALIEAVVVSAITIAASPLLASVAYRALASRDAMARAGMNQDPGIPPLTWAVTGVLGVVLILVMVAPLLRRGASFIEAESAQARPRRGAAFQRGGLDLALLVLAGLAYWQLRSYESPVIADGGVARLDPLLAAGPALALLAGALVAVRLIPAASKALEALAARGRRAVMPLAAWEVGRRSARAVSAILLLTLAISIGAFSMAYLASWRQSQDDQAQYHHPADAVVTDVPGTALAQAAQVSGEDLAASAEPALNRSSVISTQTDLGFGDEELTGRPTQLVASTATGLEVYTEGRAGEDGAAAIPAALETVVPESRSVIELPDAADGIAMTVTPSTSTTALTDILVSLRAVVTDATGAVATLDLGTLAVDGEPQQVEATFAPLEDLDHLARPFSITGLQSVWLSTAGESVSAGDISAEGALTLRLSIDEISALTFDQATPVDGVDPVFAATAVEVDLGAPWYASESNVSVTSLEPDGDQLRVEMLTSATALRFRPAALAQTAQPVAESVPIVLTRSLATRLSLEPGEQVRIGLEGSSVLATVADVVPLLPSERPRQEAVITDLDALQVALVQAGAATAVPDAWWIDVADDDLDAYVGTLPAQASVTTQVGEATALKEDPLRVATQAALWLVTAAAIVLAAVGFAVHAVVTVRARLVEFAQLRAVGLGQGQLVRVVAVESVLLTVLGLAFGLGLGVALAYLVAPLVSVGADGRPPLPSVVVEIPWTTVGLLAVEAVVVVMVAIIIVAAMIRRIRPAQTLRSGEQ
ncbi:FtsX-like permease family protein [Demequina activiva]|uniref:ABC3 transporter permease C-terminal domain-containing protein n=1 Tax=Demequina activiva TaxID=1582364 RepID=A0A919Q558_9MICO|nr:FtsX-like permease family protein [Demequina activiva]GIG55367.1 hypothetical protein Dac01nite_21190 [Demequina activiva]